MCQYHSSDFYPRPPYGGRLPQSHPPAYPIPISIHALLILLSKSRSGNFYPRPPYGGRPVGSALGAETEEDFYPRPPCGGRHSPTAVSSTSVTFLSTPSVWRATGRKLRRDRPEQFLSTPSVWRATFHIGQFLGIGHISIHALRVEGDPLWKLFNSYSCISIHALRVEGDTALHDAAAVRFISIHALRVEGDL